VPQIFFFGYGRQIKYKKKAGREEEQKYKMIIKSQSKDVEDMKLLLTRMFRRFIKPNIEHLFTSLVRVFARR
jgi:hypothetical protein